MTQNLTHTQLAGICLRPRRLARVSSTIIQPWLPMGKTNPMKLILGFIAVTLCYAQPAAWDTLASIDQGHRIRIETSAKKYTGSFGASVDSIRLNAGDGEISIARSEVVRVYLQSRSSRLRNTLIGAGIGTALGVTAYSTLGRLLRNEGGQHTEASLLVSPIAIGAAVGAVLPTGSMKKVYDAKLTP